jgi:Protein of unknown function (DUF2934)
MANEVAKPGSSRLIKTRATTATPTPMRKSGVSTPNDATKSNSILNSSATSVTPEMRRLMVAEAAYYIPANHGFESGHEVEDWLLAEKQIETVLATPRA